MRVAFQRRIGWVLVFLGLLVVLLCQKIVFPGLELLVGIETVVGRENVVYEADGSYIYTNPGAMIRWILSVATVGLAITFTGSLMIFRARHKASRVGRDVRN